MNGDIKGYGGVCCLFFFNTKVLTTSHIRNWIRNGALEELEMVVLEGQVFHTMQC